MPADAAQLARTWFEEVWNQGKTEAIDRLMTEDVVIHGLVGPHGPDLRGPDQFKPFHESFRAAIPDIHIEVLDTITEGDRVAVRCRVTGTHTGRGIGIEPTGRKIDFGGVSIVRMCGDRFCEGWNYFDFLACYQQIGVIPALDPADAAASASATLV